MNKQTLISYIISAIIYLIGGIDKMFIALIIFMSLDYITGIMKAVKKHKLSSKVGFNGLAKKLIILVIVCVANIVDININAGGMIRGCIITYYICNEGISILENASYFKVSYPRKLKDVLDEWNKESED